MGIRTSTYKFGDGGRHNSSHNTFSMHHTKKRGTYLIAGDINLDDLVKVVSATFLHYKINIFHFISNTYLGGGGVTLRLYWYTFSSTFIIPLMNLACCSSFCDVYLMVIFLFPLLLPSFQFSNLSFSVRKSCHFSPYIFIQLFMSLRSHRFLQFYGL